MVKMLRAQFIFLLVLASPLITYAQLPTGTFLGVVKDASGAVVPGATLTARNLETGLTRTTVSGSDGEYRFAALPVGSYELRAEQTGFGPEVHSGLTLAVSQEAVINFALQVGTVQSTVSVTTEAPIVNTTSGSLGALVDEQEVADLPLNGRNYIDLTLMQPGINDSRTTGGTMQYSGTWFSSNGAPVRSNNYMLDGAILSSVGGVSTASVSGQSLGVEGIREYRVMTNSFSAEYGLLMGSQMMIVSKGGTNQFHGSLFEYVRNSALDARNFFDYTYLQGGQRIAQFQRNNFGASLGGPIQKEKTFFFATVEAVRERKGVPVLSTTLPATAKVNGGAGGVPVINSAVVPFLQFFPNPTPGLSNNQFAFTFIQPANEVYSQYRLDQAFSASDTAFFRYTVDNGNKTQVSAFPGFTDIGGTGNQYGTLSESHVFSTRVVNTGQLSYSRPNLKINPGYPDLITNPQYEFINGQAMGQISVSGLSTVGPDSTYPRQFKQDLYTFSDDVFFTQGKSAWKFGTLINHFRQYMQQSFDRGGVANFANISSFLLGQASSIVQPSSGSLTDKTFAFYTLGFYIQNDLKVRSNLTLNLGLRYEFQTDMIVRME